MNLDLAFLIFFIAIGASVGSFLNVVIYRLPAGRSIVHPPSACPRCQRRIAWYDNIPVASWLILRGRCRHCAQPISPQYPIVEALVAILFGGLYAALYLSDLRPDFADAGFARTWPVFCIYLLLVGGLFACVAIDARHYVIPLSITWLIAGAAVIVLPAWAWLSDLETSRILVEFGRTIVTADRPSPLPLVTSNTLGMALGGTVGLAAAIVLMRSGILPRSFDEAEFQPAGSDQAPDAFLAHPHPRREVLKECLFLILPVVGVNAGYWLGVVAIDQSPPWLSVLGAVLTGYLAGAGVVWATRILGTLAFGKEAMGLGDVHLMAAVGAVTGWVEPTVAFFLAPFFGLAWALVSAGVGTLLKRQVRVIPYGPHLALASLLLIIFRQPIVGYLDTLLHQPL